MRVCLVARNRFHDDPRARAIHTMLARAGHHVDVVAIEGGEPRAPVTVTVPKSAGPSNKIGGLVNRLLPDPLANRLLESRLVAACVATAANVYFPLHVDMLQVAIEAARRTRSSVQTWPGMPRAAEVDLIDLIPRHPDRALPARGLGPSYTRADQQAARRPENGRHRGERAVICYRKTRANPGRYVESALERSGLEVRVETEGIDLTTVDPATRFVLFVEGPYPSLEVTGATPVPVLFWVHHGEHHLFANLRLTERYRADTVLLAHSWHLAYWFPTPVHRFPFAVAPELLDAEEPLDRRRYDVAMVGSKLREEAWQYRRRQDLIQSIESILPGDRVAFVEGVTPEEMATLYGNARIVINEGGSRHHPITMRVFEAMGGGAALLTDPAPGLEMLFDEEDHYSVITDGVSDVQRLLADLETTRGRAERSLAHALGHHTYDHRVDDLMRIAATTGKRELLHATASTPLARLIDRDVEVQRVVHHASHELVDQLPDREVWALRQRKENLDPTSMDASVITAESTEGLDALLAAARIRIYARGEVAGLDAYLEAHRPGAVSEWQDGLRRIDLMAEAYRAGPVGDR